jgi:hypothetical protein
VSVRRDDELAQAGNRISALFVHLPVQFADPVTRLLVVSAQARHAKQLHARIGGDALGALAECVPGALLGGAARLYAGLGLADRHRPIYNVVISNVRGPEAPLFAAGARVAACYPTGPIFDGALLNLTVLSYAGTVHFGALGCARRISGVEALPAAFAAEVRALVDAALAESGQERAAAAGGA